MAVARFLWRRAVVVEASLKIDTFDKLKFIILEIDTFDKLKSNK